MNHFKTQRALMNTNSKHMANLLFFECLRLTFLYKIYETSGKASEYAKQTIIRPLSSSFTMRDTDIKAMLWYFDNTDKLINKTSNDDIFLNRVNVDNHKIIAFLRRIMQKQDVSMQTDVFLKGLQRDLMIDDPKLRAMLTLVLKWNTLKSSEMDLLVERIKNYGLLNLRRGYLTKVMNRYAQNRPRDEKKDDSKFTPMDVVMTALSGLTAKWAHDSRKKNQDAFSRFKDDSKK